MIEHIFRSARVLRRLRTSVFFAAIDDYVTYLAERGHPPSTIQQYVQAVEHFGGWLRRARCSVERVNEQVIERFVHGHLARCACPPPCSAFIRFGRLCGICTSCSAARSAWWPFRHVRSPKARSSFANLKHTCGRSAEQRRLRASTVPDMRGNSLLTALVTKHRNLPVFVRRPLPGF